MPDCRECGGVLKPAVVFFGENVPRARVEDALGALARADALLVVGSSLMVYSGFRFVLAAERLGVPVAAVNQGRTRADDRLHLKLEADCASALPAAVAAAGCLALVGLGVALLLAPPGAAGQADRVQQYLGLAEATVARPITPAELDAAVLSAAGVEDVARLFETSLAEGLVVGGAFVTPELGGEATLDGGRLRFVTYPDPVHR